MYVLLFSLSTDEDKLQLQGGVSRSFFECPRCSGKADEGDLDLSHSEGEDPLPQGNDCVRVYVMRVGVYVCACICWFTCMPDEGGLDLSPSEARTPCLKVMTVCCVGGIRALAHLRGGRG